MSRQDAKQERIQRENDYLIARIIEMDAELKEAIERLHATLEIAQAKDSLELLTADDVGKKFKVSDQSIYRLVRQSRFPCLKLGSQTFRFDPVAIRRWLNQESNRELMEHEQELAKTKKERESNLQYINRAI